MRTGGIKIEKEQTKPKRSIFRGIKSGVLGILRQFYLFAIPSCLFYSIMFMIWILTYAFMKVNYKIIAFVTIPLISFLIVSVILNGKKPKIIIAVILSLLFLVGMIAFVHAFVLNSQVNTLFIVASQDIKTLMRINIILAVTSIFFALIAYFIHQWNIFKELTKKAK
ncbi:hypothetical protein [Mycoplasmopsis pullorum]|uniref:Uncharacterized protein n=1 Tax=Mycoplasmopsis pullorum TaxID=48003 RepID=A0A1L4FSS3_9BACT|nr:hypothetical protein [Mycoplasmopsis pullorum]APJ38677.1 hypothetical protein BLA55_03385 [Mycoplasmopsis pullorum]